MVTDGSTGRDDCTGMAGGGQCRKGVIDLHLHSTASDGVHRPSELFSMAARAGLEAVALTDHDTVDGVAEFLASAQGGGPQALAGVEIGVENDERRGLKEVHILAYFVSCGDNPLTRALRRLQAAKREWALEQVELLRSAGFDLPIEEVEREARGGPAPRRPHIWKVLSKHNPGMGAETFYRNTDFGGDWYVPKPFVLSMEEAVEAIRRSGAVPVLAHPAFYGTWPEGALSVLDIACDAGIMGVEAYYDYEGAGYGTSPFNAAVTGRLVEEARRRGLAVTGGSDFHGAEVKSARLGAVPVPFSCLDELRRLKP